VDGWLINHLSPLTLLGVYSALSVVLFVTYGVDKSAAQSGAWRVPESTLHLLALVGGWPGALVAQRVFRHKTRKQPFRTLFWVSIFANCAGLTWILYRMANRA